MWLDFVHKSCVLTVATSEFCRYVTSELIDVNCVDLTWLKAASSASKQRLDSPAGNLVVVQLHSTVIHIMGKAFQFETLQRFLQPVACLKHVLANHDDDHGDDGD